MQSMSDWQGLSEPCGKMCTPKVLCGRGCSVCKSILTCLGMSLQGWMSGQAFAHSLVASVPVATVDKYLARVDRLPHALAGCKCAATPETMREAALCPLCADALQAHVRLPVRSGASCMVLRARKPQTASVAACAAGVPQEL